MGILNTDDMENQLDDYVERVWPTVEDLRTFLRLPHCKILVVDRLNEIDVEHEIRTTIPAQTVRVLDIAGASDADHDRLVDIFVRYGAHTLFLLKNIDRASGESIRTLINCAMKSDCSYPTSGQDELDFSPLRIVATGCAYPRYLQEGTGSFIVEVKEPDD
ncbi:MAG: hypothetical protein K2O78_10015 [Muribaculaceae bacterium]|nr:hypothetical protein [Muribaculaceae bacterium]